MQIIIVSAYKQWQFTLKRLLLLLGLISTVPFFLVMLDDIKNVANTYLFPTESEVILPSFLKSDATLGSVEKGERLTAYSERMLEDYYAQRLGRLQAELLRLKALSARISEMIGIDTSSFLLKQDPAQGGIESVGKSISLADFKQSLEVLEDDFNHQGQTLLSLQNFYFIADSIQGAIPQGSPSKKGWLSSHYGMRIDPFSGKNTFHAGVDIAGKEGSEVLSVADGIISWTGKKTGYGELVEVDHGNGYITRYAHNKKVTVTVGDRIRKGQPIALMGSTGRSTGSHIHFEVLRDGVRINPTGFLKG